jgi:hypothetical protein
LGLNVRIERNAPPGSLPFVEVFQGFDRIGAVKRIFGAKTASVLGGLNVEVAEGRGYMRINDEKGSIMINSSYLRDGRETYLYLDVIHELVHIRQHREGKELWDKKFSYVDRPTEIEAYKVAVDEARRIGLSTDELVDYLKVDWVTDAEFHRMLSNLGVER